MDGQGPDIVQAIDGDTAHDPGPRTPSQAPEEPMASREDLNYHGRPLKPSTRLQGT